ITDTGSMVEVLLLLPLVARLITRIGSRGPVFLGMIPYGGGRAGLFWVTQRWQVLICYVVLMSGRYMMSTAGVPLEAALIDDNERVTGTRKTGSFAALKALMAAPVTGSQMAIYMAIISAYGYDQLAVTQDATAQFGIRLATA